MKNRKVMLAVDKLIVGLVTAAMSISFVPGLLDSGMVFAASSKNQNNTCIGTTGITNPDEPATDKDWSGSYVYFGTYGGSSIRFRVLAKDSTTYSTSKTLFLDSDKTLLTRLFDYEDIQDVYGYSNSWGESDIKIYLNETFISNCFSDLEQSAMANSYANAHSLVVGSKAGNVTSSVKEKFNDYVALTGEKVFLLDAEEASNVLYGYSNTETASNNRKKIGSSKFWWLRSASCKTEDNAGYISYNGKITTYQINEKSGIAPALNVDQSSIIFSTIVNDGSFNKSGTEYKLTLNDKNLSISVQSGKKITVSGTTVTVPYTITGSDAGNATRASVLILDKEYKAGNPNNAKILYYDELGGTFDKNGTGTFTLPSSLNLNDWGTKYFVYIIAEDVNGSNATDYASVPVKISVPSNSAGPTSKPTATPTPTKKPTATPTKKPTPTPTKKPTATPTKKPTATPTKKPTATPTKKPTVTPTVKPTAKPTTKPTVTPTKKPTATPTKKPTVTPTAKPTVKPTTKPTVTPTPSPKPKSTWVQEGGKWYYYDANSKKATGWVKDGTKWYYCDKNGVMQTGWIQDGGKWYYMSASGAMSTGWVKVGTTWYYLSASGAMATGWVKVGNTWYYMSASGAMVTGWYKVGTKWYYFDDTGAMKTGWHQTGKYWYYLSPATGEMVTGKVSIDGKMNNFDESGVWLGYV